MKKKIKDNESIKPFVEMLKIAKLGFNILDKIPLVYKLSPKTNSLKEQFLDIEGMSNILDLPDQFNDLFSKNGWICYNSLSQEILEKSVKFGLQGKMQEAHQLLINSIDESAIDLIILKSKSRDHFSLRVSLLKLLKNDYLEERYHACIPLLLALLDGLANDVSKHIGFFTEGLNLELYDSITAHESGLPFLKNIMNSSRKNTTEDEITIPYRNGILHGRDLNFANKEVASKCWWALASFMDWSDEKKINKTPKNKLSFIDNLKQTNEQINYSKRIQSWKKRPIHDTEYWQIKTLETLEKIYPEYYLLQFLDFWKNKRWGLMHNLLAHTVNDQSATIKHLKDDYSSIQLLNFSILNAEDETSAISVITAQLTFIKNKEELSKPYSIHMNYLDKNGSLLLRNEKDGQWRILQSSISGIIFNTST